ncbi:MAG: HNH endonuclease signature motif containing protein, partial [Dietzia sp.]|nr:HNH endonuclease signature motif containing protein [Dietzia sp.]
PDCDATTRARPTRDTTVYLITDTTTADAETTPASAPVFVFGAGLTPAPLLDELLDGGRIREICHPGQIAPEPRYTPSRALAEFIRCRDLTCRFPGCDTPATLADIDHTVPYPLGPTHPSILNALCRFHHLLKTFWTGTQGWHDRQHPDGTITWTSPTGHTYTTHPGSRLLFPTFCRPTATLWTGDPPTLTASDRRGLMMPRRRYTRAYNRARTITAERQRNAQARAAAPTPNGIARNHIPYESPSGWREPDYGNDPPPF